ncbi:MAG: GntR family transcriptional regulator, partial [Vicinamibacteraceae bacterium]|nr:GntR family transcriptional regulator [Vicinamibacteraceae bacterium]
VAIGLLVDPSSPIPLWAQVQDGLRRLVACGSLRPGDPVPSVRDAARELGLNPATIAKAYQALADAGVLVVRRGDGTYVAENPATLTTHDRRQVLARDAGQFIANVVALGVTEDEVAAAVRRAWRLAAASMKKGSQP